MKGNPDMVASTVAVDSAAPTPLLGEMLVSRQLVSAAMVSRLDKVDVRAPIEALLPVFDRGHVAIVMDGERFLGLITRIDLLNYLRRRVQ